MVLPHLHPSLLCATAFLLGSAFAKDAGVSLWVRSEAALDAGHPQVAESLFTLAGQAAGAARHRHQREILEARLAASRGDWRTSESRLQAWKRNESRPEGSGEIFFWLGWVALHQARIAEADSLFVLASAYVDEPRAQEALEYRFAALLDPSANLQHYLRGLPESPLSLHLRIASLEKVVDDSRLYPHARWYLALHHLAQGDTVKAREILSRLAHGPASVPALRARVLEAFLTESMAPDSALTTYEALLTKHQQGVLPEFSRKRAKFLREHSPK
jgi:tetratricopeptide (TPR) repeat protein